MSGLRLRNSIRFASSAGFALTAALLVSASFPVPSYASGFTLGAAADYALLYTGGNGMTLSINNGPGPGGDAINGNLAVANTGKIQLSGPLVIDGNIDFANSIQCTNNCMSNGNIVVNGTTTSNVAAVTTDLNYLSTLSQTLGAEPGTSISITSGGSLNEATTCTPDASGNCVYTLSSINFPNGTYTITGDGIHNVVINIPNQGGDVQFHGEIVLVGLTSDQVLFNFTSGDYTNFTGGNKLDINTNQNTTGTPTMGTFLDLNGSFNINHSVLDGRIFAGDSLNSSIVSGGLINQPSSVPEPTSILLFGTVLLGMGRVLSKKLSFTK